MFVRERCVYTYEPGDWPQGILTGYEDDAGGFVLEHVVCFRPFALRPMLRAGLVEAKARGWQHITLRIPNAYPDGLRTLAERMDFAPYARDEVHTYYVTYP